jgi:hypothetical protein
MHLQGKHVIFRDAQTLEHGVAQRVLRVIQRQDKVGDAQHVNVRLKQGDSAQPRVIINCTEVVSPDLWDEALARYHSRLVWPVLSCIVGRSATSNLESLIPMSHLFLQFCAHL